MFALITDKVITLLSYKAHGTDAEDKSDNAREKSLHMLIN
jgi:hypothetical protein